MKVLALGKENPNLWTTQESCTGKGWAQDTKPCGALLEVSELDIISRKHKDMSGETDIYFGFKCPICGCFTELNPLNIPLYVRSRAQKQ